MAPFNNAPETGTRSGRTAGRGAGAGALVGGAAFVSVIALCALVIAYNGIYQFARIVHDEGGYLAHVFPVTFTLLVLMAFWVSYVLRAAPPGERLWVDVVLIPLLILAAAVPMVLHSSDMVDRIADRHEGIVQVVVAVAPLAALLVAFLLWMTVRAHVRRRNSGGRPRANPSDDRATVLRGRPRQRTAPAEEEETEALKNRLLRLGADEPDEAEGSAGSATRAAPLPSRTSTLRRDGGQDRERAEREDAERAEREDAERAEREETERAERERAERERADAAVSESGTARGASDVADRADAPTVPIPLEESGSAHATGTSDDGEDTTDPSVPPLPLPRRARDSDNPIKRAAEEPPVVPVQPAPSELADADEDTDAIGATPVPGEARAAEATDIEGDGVPDHLADEGFEHDPPVADPSSDEAEAPVPAPVDREPHPVSAVGTTAESSEGGASPTSLGGDTLELWPEGNASGALTEAEEPPGEDARTGVEPGEPSLWEPPGEDAVPSRVAEYVPPVWTPPEDDSTVEPDAAPLVGRSTTADDRTPVLDHDTGPSVRAAFRMGSVPPGAARPEPEPLPEPVPLPEPEPLPDDEPEPEPQPEGVPGPEVGAEPEPERATVRTSRPVPWSRGPVEKRPMVLKPKRPPMPDFASGPPSRRVRSEPLPPEEPSI
ncbi:DUF2637 domain-containing protein [Nocardiopsis sp. NPDC006938]|uniref:DUF2637 domain-containing protein n=1 Tax=Nocardiopsis sp. NPDC006938 TaxID=3364337 RepID=UPI00369BEB6D